jgi:hypothetical protein
MIWSEVRTDLTIEELAFESRRELADMSRSMELGLTAVPAAVEAGASIAR